jgi:IS605 OrfB family transposase
MILTYKYRLKGRRSRTWKLGLSPKWPSQYDLQKLTGGTSRDLGIHAQTIQSVCEQFTKSRDLHKKCPRFRRSGGPKRSLGWVPFQKQSRQFTPGSVTYLGSTYRFFGAKRRPLPATAKGGCFVEDARGHWWVCFQVEVADETSDLAQTSAIGIDLGLKSLATLSTGEKIETPRTYRLWEDKLIIAQRARRTDRVRVLHAKIANVRKNHLHKLSTRLVHEHGAIYVGDVSSSQLGRTQMAKSVYDASWSTFRIMLRYKARRHGVKYAEVDERFSTQICSSCGNIPTTRPKGIADLGIREWVCSSCGASHDRDVNAAKNILATGLSAQPPAEESRVAHGR